MGEEKKTQLGQTPGRTHRPTGSQQPAVASTTPVPAASGTPAPNAASSAALAKAKTSYLPEAPDPLLGALIADRYKVIKKLGEGGMGAVYLAQHTVLEKSVALKVLHGEFARKADLVERFMQEAKAASRIRHENVIDISDFGATPDGLVFFAMELLQGHDLHEEIARARLSGHLLPWSRTKKIFLQICSALTAAHARGIVHRDLKPENVYLVEFLGDPDFVKLLDFGIAKLTDVSNEEGGRKLTKTGMLFGTPEYMSPEQARGDQVDHRVDVYAMGCILFQLVTNHVPFEADNFMGVLSQHLTQEPPQIAPETFDQIGAPRALTEVIDKALEKDRNKRWQTIEELANAVRTASGDPLPADKSMAMQRAPSVPAPANTTRARPPTGTVEPIRGPEATGRIKTQWTGNISVPEEEVAEAPREKKKSALPLILGGVGVAAIGAVVAVIALKKSPPAAPPTPAPTGSAAVAVPQPPPPPPPQVPQEPALPDNATIKFESTPKGADVIEVATGKRLGSTPYTFTVPGSKTPRQFQFHLKGYGDTTVELVPNRAEITYTQPLTKGATKPGNVVTKLPDTTTTTTTPDTGTGAVTKPDTTTTTVTVKQPDEPKGSDTPQVKPPDVKPPDVKPPDTQKPKEDCPDDEQPCLKTNIPGMGSASK